MPKTAVPEAEPTPQPLEAGPLYAIDAAQLEAGGRSFWALASSRFCRSCQRKYGVVGSGEEAPRTKRSAKFAKEPKAGDPCAIIKGCCAQSTGYLDSQLPIAEAMFRVLLARGNEPIDAVTMKAQLDSWAAGAERRRDLSLPAVQRILDHASFYCIRPIVPK